MDDDDDTNYVKWNHQYEENKQKILENQLFLRTEKNKKRGISFHWWFLFLLSCLFSVHHHHLINIFFFTLIQFSGHSVYFKQWIFTEKIREIKWCQWSSLKIWFIVCCCCFSRLSFIHSFICFNWKEITKNIDSIKRRNKKFDV